MQITRAVITAAGRGARQYPALDTVQKAMLPVVDRDGLTKPVLQIIAEEALESGIEGICFVVGQPFLVLLGDHLYLLAEPRRCARQLIDLAMAEKCAVSAVQAMREHLIHQYGTLTGRRLAERSDVYTIDEIIEKPNPTLAELRLQVPGLRAGHYQGCSTA